MTKPLFDRLAIIGPGLIGSSIMRAARAAGAVREIVATARSPKTRSRVAELGIADRVVETNAQAVEGADLVIVCVPVGACGAVAKEIGPHLKAGAVVSDVGSVKGSVVRDMGQHLPNNVHFVPAHPVAGTEHSGPDAGFAELFENRWCILTPPEGTDPQAVDRLAAFWRLLGAKVETMSPEHHDIVLAEDLAALQRMIRWDDGAALEALFSRTRAIRRSIIEAGQDTEAADFGRPHGHDD